MTILITGFESFGKVMDNPSQRIVEHLANQKRPNLITQILPVDYVRATDKLIPLIEKHKPDAILLLGVAQMRKEISLERIAVNINDASIPDNEGNLKQGQQIVPDAPVGYWSTLPLEVMYDSISSAEIPVKYSNHAGAYLCNHVMYRALHYLAMTRKADIPCGFIHVPDVTAVPLKQQIQVIELCLQVLKKETV